MNSKTVFPQSLHANTQILCIDNNQERSKLLTHLFLQAGYSEPFIHTAANARQATQQLTQRPYDIVIIDLDLPDASGMDVVRNFIAQYPETSFISLTGEDNHDQMIATSIGIAGFISKPLNPATFVNTVEQISHSFVGYDVDEQTAVDLYATEAAERVLEQNCLMHWFATRLNHQIGHYMEMSDGLNAPTLSINNQAEQASRETLWDMLAVSMAVTRAQVKRQTTYIGDLIDSVASRLDGRYHMTYQPQSTTSKINIDPQIMGLVLAYVCQICQGSRFHWEFNSQQKMTTIRITSQDTPYMSEEHDRWLMIQPLLRLHQAKITRTCEAIQISLSH